MTKAVWSGDGTARGLDDTDEYGLVLRAECGDKRARPSVQAGHSAVWLAESVVDGGVLGR